uniref:SSD domain-containing protein n=1 Tax=Heterorhabditis bacteriophora TaxID=37862 RepID=A0A1I7X0Q0_HETBA
MLLTIIKISILDFLSGNETAGAVLSFLWCAAGPKSVAICCKPEFFFTLPGTNVDLMNESFFVTDNVTAWNGEREFAYRDICGVYCNESNAAVIAFLQKLKLKVDTSLPNGKTLARDFEAKLRTIFETFNKASDGLKYSLLSREREIEEQRLYLKRNALSEAVYFSDITIIAIPFLGLTILVLTVFMLITLIDFPLYRSQHLESLVGVFSPGMALWTTAGLLFWLGFPFSNILTVVPFLVITIGIDDAFLILAGWRHSTKGASLDQRLGESIAISGASVTVTSVTDVLCFAIGLFSNMPVVQLFCLYTTVALFIDFIYQMTFFTAVMSFIVKRQIRKDKDGKTNRDRETSSIEKWKAKLMETSSLFAFALPSKEQTNKRRTSLEEFINWLHTMHAKVFVIFLFFTHIGVSTYFATEVNTDFDMENLYLVDSPLTDISRRMQDFVLREAFVVNFAVHPMPNFGNSSVREEFEKMVSRLETIPLYGAGPDNTNIWTRDFTNAITFWGEDEEFWTTRVLLKNYREYGMEEKYITLSNTTEGVEVIDGFFFSVTYHNMTTFLQVEDLMKKRREILASYPQFHVLSHHPFEKVPTESAASAPSNFIQTAVSAVILMSILVLLFVMNFEAIISVVVSIISICLGIIAYLHLWNVHLDAVSLISILMSVGFSVDYSAHVCYHYFAHIESNTHHRLLSTLRGVGWPVVQSGLSTLLGK